jgi:type I restriction enzyme S subunit
MSEGNGLPKGWAEATVGDAVRPRSERVSPEDNGHLPYIGLEHIEADVMRLVGTVPASTMKSASARFYPSDVLYGRLRPYLNKVFQPDFDGLCSAEFIVLPESGVLASGFLQYRINAGDFVSFARHLNTGDRPRVDFEQIGGFRIKIPPLPEQHRIVEKIEELFSDLDAGVASLERAKANLERYRASVLKSAVEGRLTEEWRKEHPQEEDGQILLNRILRERRENWEKDQLAQFKKKGKEPPKNWQSKYKEPSAPDTSELPELPDGWVWATVEQLSTKVTDGVHKKPVYVANGIPFITVRNLTAGPGISFEETSFVRPEDHAEFCKRTHPEKGDLLISKDGTLGVVRAIRTEEPFSIFVSVALVKPVDRAMTRYWEIAFCSPQVQRQMVGKGSGLQHIHLEDLRQDCIPLPPLAEQEQIVTLVEERLSQIESAEKTIDAELIRSKRLRQGILKRAFEGKLVSQDPKDEPASVLLERIKASKETEQPKKTKKSKAKSK